MMAEVKVCRICLNVNVKMYKLEGNLLEIYYQHVLAGLDRQNILELSQYACYECIYYIQKYCLFREKCFRGHSALLQLYENNGMVTENGLKAIDRLNLGLCSNLVHFVPITYSTCNESEDFEVKDEPSTNNISDIDDTSMFLKCHDAKPENEIKVEDVEPVLDFTDEECCPEQPVRKENILKTLKSKKIVLKRLQTCKISKENCQKANESLNTYNIKTMRKDKDVSDLEIKQPKRRPGPKSHKREPPPKDTSMKDDVTVVELSIEEQLEEIAKRQNSSNYIKSVFKCTLCYKGFVDPDAFDHHLKKHDPSSGSFKCPICKFCFLTPAALKKHLAIHEKNYICKTCSYVCKSMNQAKQHQNEHKGRFYHCKHCDKATTKLTSHLSHMRTKHPSEFICDVCGYAFVSKLGLVQHRTIMHKNVTELQSSMTDKQMRYCKVCSMHCNSLQTWKRHIVSKTHLNNEKKDFTCVADDAGKASKGGEKLHRRWAYRYRNVHPTFPRAWPAKCLHCDEEVSNAHKYAGHFRRAHPDKQYPITKNHVCDICGKGYTSNAFLLCHRRTHFEDRPYKCDECPKAFFNRLNLLKHKKAHSDDRPYACVLCSKAFKLQSALDRHMQSHTGEKPYVCDVCGKAFTQSNSRKLHVKSVHLKEPAPYRKRTRAKKPRADDAHVPN